MVSAYKYFWSLIKSPLIEIIMLSYYDITPWIRVKVFN